jgi:NAD(P)-dependent dehydrogenase (short-subunit alcohol dehydrogenase family)
MRVLVIGATGTIGQAVALALQNNGHEVLGGSRHGNPRVDIVDPDSIRSLYRTIGEVDGVVSCAGSAAFKPLTELTDEDLQGSLRDKLLGQVNLVRFGIERVREGGVFVLTSGIFSRNPMPGVAAIAMVNGAVESFVRAAALDAPRRIRVNAVSPPFITETAKKMGIPTDGTLSAADNARAYVALVEGNQTGEVVFPGDRL